MKKIYYGRAIYDHKEINAVNKVLKNNSLSLIDGKNVKKLEKKISKIFGKKIWSDGQFRIFCKFTCFKFNEF